jgi:Predicted membrane protein
MRAIFDFFSFLGKEGALFIVSMIPLIELRGSIILGAAMSMPWFTVLLISLLGNILPVPFIILFGRQIITWLKKVPLFSKLATKFEAKLMLKSKKVVKYEALGLCIFVAIPLPGTGAWTGAAIAALLDMRMSRALPSISLGVLIAGIIMTLGSYGVLGAVKLLQAFA